MLREEALHTHSLSHTCFFIYTNRQTGGDCPALFPYAATKNSLQSVQAGSIPSVPETNTKIRQTYSRLSSRS